MVGDCLLTNPGDSFCGARLAALPASLPCIPFRRCQTPRGSLRRRLLRPTFLPSLHCSAAACTAAFSFPEFSCTLTPPPPKCALFRFDVRLWMPAFPATPPSGSQALQVKLICIVSVRSSSKRELVTRLTDQLLAGCLSGDTGDAHQPFSCDFSVLEHVRCCSTHV